MDFRQVKIVCECDKSESYIFITGPGKTHHLLPVQFICTACKKVVDTIDAIKKADDI